MIRTQIQLPDDLYQMSKKISARLEISLAELVRRGLEYVVSTTPCASDDAAEWKLPEPRKLGGSDPFLDPNWREEIHMARLKVAEDGEPYGGEEE